VETADPLFEKNCLLLLSDLDIDDVEMFTSKPVNEYFEELIYTWITGKEKSTKDMIACHLTEETWDLAVNIIAKYTKLNLKFTSARKGLLEGNLFLISSIGGVSEFRKRVLQFIGLNADLAYPSRHCLEALMWVLALGEIDDLILDSCVRYVHAVVKSSTLPKEIVVRQAAGCLANLLFFSFSFYPRAVSYTYEETLRKVPMEHMQDEFKKWHPSSSSDNSNGSSNGGGSRRLSSSSSSNLLIGLTSSSRHSTYATVDPSIEFMHAIPNLIECYLSALAIALEKNGREALDSGLINLPTLMFVSLFNLVSQRIEQRNAALHILRALSSFVALGSTVALTSVYDKLYRRAALAISRFAAANNVPLTLQMVNLTSTVNFSRDSWRDFIPLLAPWCKNYPTVLLGQDTSSSALLLLNIYTFTKKMHLHSPDLVEDLWFEMIQNSSFSEVTSGTILDFLMEEYQKEITILTTISFIQDIIGALCKHPPTLPILIKKIVGYLKDFTANPPPKSKMEYLVWQVKKEMVSTDAEPNPPVTIKEIIALKWLLNLSYEFDTVFIPYLPKLFVNALTLFKTPQILPDSTKLLENLFQSLGFRCRVVDGSFSQVNTGKIVPLQALAQFRDKFFVPERARSLHKNIEFLRGWIGHLSHHNPDLVGDLARESFTWAVCYNDNRISLDAYRLFLNINNQHDYTLLETLALNLFESFRMRNDEKATVIVQILLSTPAEVLQSPKCLSLSYKIALLLLFSWTKKHYHLGLELLYTLNKISHASENFNVEEADNFLYEIWKSQNPVNVDVTVSKELLKGLTAQDSLERTLELYELSAIAFCNLLPTNNILIAANLIIHAILLTSGDTKVSKVLALIDDVCKVQRSQPLDRNSSRQSLFLSQKELRKSTPEGEAAEQHQKMKLLKFKEAFQKYQDHFSSDFVDHFVQCYRSCFGKYEGYFVSRMLTVLLKNGKALWQTPTLMLFSKLLPVIFDGRSWKPEYVESLSSLFRECTFDEDEEFCKAAESCYFFLLEMDNLDQSFLKKTVIRGFETAVKGITYDVHLFIGATPKEREFARTEMMKRLWTDVFLLAYTDQSENTTTPLDAESKVLNQLINQEGDRGYEAIMSEYVSRELQKQSEVNTSSLTAHFSDSALLDKSSLSVLNLTQLQDGGSSLLATGAQLHEQNDHDYHQRQQHPVNLGTPQIVIDSTHAKTASGDYGKDDPDDSKPESNFSLQSQAARTRRKTTKMIPTKDLTTKNNNEEELVNDADEDTDADDSSNNND